MNTIELEIRQAYKRMNQKLCIKTILGWEALSQYGYSLQYCNTQLEAEVYVINYYKARMHLLNQE